MAYCEWLVPRNFLTKLVDALATADKYNGKFKKVIKSFSFTQKPFFVILCADPFVNCFQRVLGPPGRRPARGRPMRMGGDVLRETVMCFSDLDCGLDSGFVAL